MRRRRRPWAVAGFVLVVVLAVVGLVVLAAALILVVGLNNWASNK